MTANVLEQRAQQREPPPLGLPRNFWIRLIQCYLDHIDRFQLSLVNRNFNQVFQQEPQLYRWLPRSISCRESDAEDIALKQRMKWLSKKFLELSKVHQDLPAMEQCLFSTHPRHPTFPEELLDLAGCQSLTLDSFCLAMLYPVFMYMPQLRQLDIRCSILGLLQSPVDSLSATDKKKRRRQNWDHYEGLTMTGSPLETRKRARQAPDETEEGEDKENYATTSCRSSISTTPLQEMSLEFNQLGDLVPDTDDGEIRLARILKRSFCYRFEQLRVIRVVQQETSTFGTLFTENMEKLFGNWIQQWDPTVVEEVYCEYCDAPIASILLTGLFQGTHPWSQLKRLSLIPKKWTANLFPLHEHLDLFPQLEHLHIPRWNWTGDQLMKSLEARSTIKSLDISDHPQVLAEDVYHFIECAGARLMHLNVRVCEGRDNIPDQIGDQSGIHIERNPVETATPLGFFDYFDC